MRMLPETQLFNRSYVLACVYYDVMTHFIFTAFAEKLAKRIKNHMHTQPSQNQPTSTLMF